MFKDKKTTITAIVGFGAYLAATFGLEVSTDTQIGIVTTTLFILGLFSRDTNNNPVVK